MCTNQSTTKAILVVSFGTSYHDTREKTIDCIEQDIAQTFPVSCSCGAEDRA